MRESLFKRYTSTLSLALLLIAVSFVFPSQAIKKDKYTLKPVVVEPGLRELASSKKSMVVSAHSFATQAGLEMLRRGGNAVDAATAATMVVAVIHGNVSLAGGHELTYYEAKSKKTININAEPNSFKEDVMPYNGERDNMTGRSIRVPGSFAGWYYGIKKYGALPWKDVMEPAIFYAENGFPIGGGTYSDMRSKYATLTLRDSGRRIFAPNGFLPGVGEIFKQPELAETLRKIAEQGPDYFYKGPFAEEMVKSIREIGGKPTLEDFSSYQPLELEPVRGSYKEYQIVGPPLPSRGVTTLIEAMNILENVDLKSMGYYTQSADSLQWMIETFRVITEDTERYSGVPELDRALSQTLRSKEIAKSRYNFILHKIEQMKRQQKEKAEKETLLVLEPAQKEKPLDGTNNGVAIDKDGNLCSIIQSIYGTSYSFAGLWIGGIVVNASGGFLCLPGERIVSQMPATIVFKGDKPYFGVGSSSGYPNPFFIITNALVWDKNFKEAEEAPRFRVEGTKVTIEHRIDENVAEELRKRGYQIEWAAPYTMANAQMAGIDPNSGIRYGAPDPRGIGYAEGQK